MSDESPAISASEADLVEQPRAGVKRGAVVEIVGFGLNAVLRLGSNLILTRLLFPDVFGLMAMMQVILYGVWMLSDVGIAQAVIASPRGDDERFLNTAWTMQAIRGVGLWLLMCALSYPAALMMREPRLAWMLPIGGFFGVIQGLHSTRVFTLRRRVNLLPLMLLDLSTQLSGLTVTVLGAMKGYGIAALLAGQIASAVVYSLASHFLPGSKHRNRFHLEADARHQIVRFGRWILFSSGLSFVSARADQMLLGRLLGAAKLGVYNVALNFSEMPYTLIQRLIDSVVYPTIARVHNERPQDFAREYYRLRLWLDAACQTGAGALIGIADVLIASLYDARWQGAAFMLKLLTLRTSINAMVSAAESAVMARGMTELTFKKNVVTTISLVTLIPIGSYFFGLPGVIWASVAANATAFLVLWPVAYRLGFLRLHREALVLPFLGVGYVLGQGVSPVLQTLVTMLKEFVRSLR